MGHELRHQGFEFSSPLGFIHTITHNIGTLTPQVVIINAATNEYIIPATVTIIDSNTIEITVFDARQLYGIVS